MANINVTFTDYTITVDENTSNVNVTTTTNNITVSSASVASNADIRAAISATSPITYNSTTGVIGINSNAILTGKTTTDLPEGANLYFTNARVAAYLTSNFTTTDIPEGANLYYTVARANAAFNNIVTSNVVTFENVAVFNEGIRTPLYDAGNVSGTVTLTTENGTAQEIRLTGNVGYLSFSDWLDGQVLHVVVKQDGTGGRIIDFTNPNYATNGWEFLNASTTIDTAANAETLITIQNFSSKRYATINTGNSTSLTNAQVISYIANNSLTVGGNLTVNTNATISGNNLTVANIIIPGGNNVLNPSQGAIKLNAYSNLKIIANSNGATIIDIPGDPNTDKSVIFNKKIEGLNAIFTSSLVAGSLNTDATGNITTVYGSIYSQQGGDIYSTNLGSAPGNRSGNIYTLTGNIIGAYLHGNGSNITGIASNAGVVSYIATQPLTVGGNLTVNGNINATGNINYQNVTDLYVTDQKITLNSNAATNANVEIISNRPTATNTMLKWNEQSTRWEFTNNGTTYYPIPTSTTDLAEGANLWFSNARVNSFIQDNITTTDIDEGTNLYFTAARARGNISAAENITYSNSTGIIGLANSLANVNSVTSELGQNFTINSTNKLVLTQKFKNTTTQTGNVTSDGYALFGGVNQFYLDPGFTYSGATNLDSIFLDSVTYTAGSNALTGVTITTTYAGEAATINSVLPYYVWSPTLPTAVGGTGSTSFQTPFPYGTYVTSVDAANSIIYLNQTASTSGTSVVSGLQPGAYDSSTGLLLSFISEYDNTFAGSRTTIDVAYIHKFGAYGYPKSGVANTDFVYAIGNSSNYAVTTSNGRSISEYMIGRTKIESDSIVLQAPRGLLVGNADMSVRSEGAAGPSFGVNVLWDGTANTTLEYGGATPVTQVLINQYSDGSPANVSGNETFTGPRILFTAARGNKNQDPSQTYARVNNELGRISWWTAAKNNLQLSTTSPPAWISAVSGNDHITYNSGLGLYFANSPNIDSTGRALYLASSKGNTLISSAANNSGVHQPIIFAPAHVTTSGNSVYHYNQTVVGTDNLASTSETPSGAHFGQFNYANTSALTGSRFSVTNGNNFATQHEGNIALSIDRNLNSGNVTHFCRTGSTNYLGSSNPDRIRFTYIPEGLANATPVTISGFTNATVAGALNGNVFYVKGPFSAGGGLFNDYELYSDSGLTTGVNLGVTNINAGPGAITFTRTNSVTAKDWSFVLAQGSNNLILTEDGVNTTTFESGGNVTVTGNINLTGRLLGYDRVYGEFCYTAGNITPAAADTVYTFPFDTTNMASDVVANNTSRINIVKPGIFKLIMSLQVKNSDNAADHTLRFWLRKNGADVANSATLVTPLKLQEQVIAMDWMVESDGDDYWEIAYYVNNTGVSFPNYTSISSPVTAPSCPPIIVNVIPVGA